MKPVLLQAGIVLPIFVLLMFACITIGSLLFIFGWNYLTRTNPAQHISYKWILIIIMILFATLIAMCYV